MTRRARLATIVLGLVLGAIAGGYVHRWWGHGMFATATLISMLAALAIGLVPAVAIVESQRGHAQHAATTFLLGACLVVGALGGAALGPGYSPATNYEGSVTVHVTAPTSADWSGTGFCWIDANASEVGGLWIGRWTGPGGPTEGSFGFTETGAPALRFGNDGNGYDLFGFPRPSVAVREVAARRLSGEVAFGGMPARGRGLLADYPGAPLDGTARWTCDPSRPAR